MLHDQLAIWNNTRFTYPDDKPVHLLIEAQAMVFSNKEAVRFSGEGISYRQLNETANQLAGVLLSYGIQTGNTIGLSVDRTPAMLIALLAILKSGAAYIPLDPEYPQQRISYMLEDAGAKILLTSKKYKGNFPSPATELLLEEAMEKAKTYPVANPGISVTANHLAYIIYTSGSTGKPKGVMVKHGNLVNLLCSMQQIPVISQYDKLLAVTTISFDIAALELFLPLVTGAQVVITDVKVSRDGFALLDLVRKEKITLMQATPVTWKIMLAAGWAKKADMRILCCGEAMAADLAKKLIPLCRNLYNFYGPTETTIYSTGTEILSTDKAITIGGPIGNTQIYIFDEQLQLLPPGEAGEIYIGGDGVASGYCNMPELTAERFIDDPFTNDKRKKLFKTGDIGRWTNDGKVYFMGRIDEQIKIRGFRIEPAEIETVLLQQPGIRDAVVIAREDTPGNKVLVTYIVAGEGTASNASAEQVQKWKKALQAVMPDFMVPHEYVLMQQFPLLPNGKINRKELPKPVRRSTDIKNAVVDSGIEKLVAGIWAEALHMDSVAMDDNFFDLGGHSLIAVQIMTRLEKETGKLLPIAALFEWPTVRQLSHFLQLGNISASWDSLVPVKPFGSKPPLYIIHGDGLNVMIFNSITKHMDINQPVFGLQPKGMNGIDEPDESMEEIAAYYIARISEHNPNGPYCLAGYSFGGIVAFEMAKQLEKMGKDVKLLAMFDTNVGNIEYLEPGIKRVFKKIQIQFPKMVFIVSSLRKHPGNILAYQWLVAKRKWRTMLAKAGIVKENGPEKISPYEKLVIKKHLAAYEKYIMSAYAGRIDLFRVQKRFYFLDDPVFLGWKPLAGKGVSIHEVPGDHRSFLLPPNDKIFATILQSVIDERVNT
jgi:amino acid adenylation domain-containing protein